MKILIPLDGSELSESVLPWLQALSERGKPQVILLRITDPFLIAPGGMPPSMGERMQRQTLEAAQEYLSAVESRFPDQPMKKVTVVGMAREEIGVVAEQHDCDLIVMASHGRSGLARWFLGSVAEGVLRVAPCPVLLMRPPVADVALFRHILIPVDGSPLSLSVPGKISHFLAPGGQVTLLRCTDLSAEDYDESESRSAIQDYLGSLRASLEEVQLEGLKPHIKVLDGEAPECIVRSAQDFGCDLIAMSTHGHGGFRHFWMGSVTEKVARRAPCPVLVYPAPKAPN